MAGLILRNVAKSYEATKVIESIDLEIKDGEFVYLWGLQVVENQRYYA